MAKAIYTRMIQAGVTGSVFIRGPKEAPAEVEAIFAKNHRVHTVAILMGDDGEVWQRASANSTDANQESED